MTAPVQEQHAVALLRVLQQQAALLRDLLAAAKAQQEAILQRDRSGIESTTEAQDELFVQLQGLEYDREQLVREALASAGREGAERAAARGAGHAGGGGPSDPGREFERFLRTLSPSSRKALTKARDEARTLLVELTAVNDGNQQLLAQELALIDMYMGVLHPDLSAEGYSEPGQARRSGGSTAVAFDTRA